MRIDFEDKHLYFFTMAKVEVDWEGRRRPFIKIKDEVVSSRVYFWSPLN